MNEHIDNTAVDWFGRVRLTEPSAIDTAAFERWRAASPENAAAFTRAERLWKDLSDLQTLPESRSLADEAEFHEMARVDNLRPSFLRRHRVPIALAASVVAAAIVLIPLLSGNRYETQIAEVRALNLPDGSRVTLGAQSKIDIKFTDSERRLRLKGGEAFFEVHQDPSRPFLVDAGDAHIRVLGTKFDVRRSQEQVNIAVLEGKVAVTATNNPSAGMEEGGAAQRRVREKGERSESSPNPQGSDTSRGTASSASGNSPIILTAGQQITTGRNQKTVPRPTNRNTPPGAWRTGRLSYDKVRLVEVIADVNRYYAAGITLASDELADLKVTTAFSVDQIDPLLNSLTTALPISAQRDPDGHVTLQPRTQ